MIEHCLLKEVLIIFVIDVSHLVGETFTFLKKKIDFYGKIITPLRKKSNFPTGWVKILTVI